MGITTDTRLAVLALGILLGALATGHATAAPVRETIALLQEGNTAERRAATEQLAQFGNQQAVAPLTRALSDPDQQVRRNAEHALWSIWHRSGQPEVDARLQTGIAAMHQGALQQAVEIFSEVIHMKPDFAEGYNKRATAYYLMQEYRKSIVDCEKTIELNPVHFGALSGTGLNYMELHNPLKALEYFQRAVEVNPNMSRIKSYIRQIKRYLSDRTL